LKTLGVFSIQPVYLSIAMNSERHIFVSSKGSPPPWAGYNGGMPDARIAVLEEIARSTRETLARLDMRLDRMEQQMEHGFKEIRGEIKAVGNEAKENLIEFKQEVKENLIEFKRESKENLIELKGDIRDLRKKQEHDFRIVFAALMTVSIGLAGLIAHAFKWL
jgi:gas vesicle protein